MKISDILQETNIAEKMPKEKLEEIGSLVVEGYDNDEQSREAWVRDQDTYMDLALQVASKKTFPWEGASNVKYPLIATAAMQFNARAYPTLVPSDGKVVQCRVVGKDPDGQKAARAKRISTHMSYQIMEEMEEWEDDMDRLLLITAILGTCFKKTYYSDKLERNCSKVVLPKDLVVNYWSKTLEDSERLTEVFRMNKRQIKERVLQKTYLDVDLGEPNQTVWDSNAMPKSQKLVSNSVDSTTPYKILEQHCYLDLDEDELAEPYVVTVEYSTKKVLRIAPRFDENGVTVDDSGNIIKIEPDTYYTKYEFVPSPDGAFYGLGFGKLLGPINESIDTLVNQLIDSGSLANLQAGFIGKGLRIKMAETRFKPGEWKAVNATGDDLKKQIMPLPTAAPSPVLFQLLGMMTQAGKELASVAEIFVGKMPGQNTPAYTTQQTIEQGMKLFTAVYKRIYRSLKKEFQKLYALNARYLDPQEEINILDEPIQQADYTDGSEKDIIPSADPQASSQFEKQQKIQQTGQLLQLGTIDPTKYTIEYLSSMGWDDPQRLMPDPNTPKQPSPQEQEAQMKQQEMQQKGELEQAKVALKAKELEFKLAMEQQAQVFGQQMKEQENQMNLKFKELEMLLEAKKADIESAQSAQQHLQQMTHSQDQHQLAMQQSHEQHKTKLQQAKEAGNKPKGSNK